MTQGLAGNLSWNIAYKGIEEAAINGKLFYPIEPAYFSATTDYLIVGVGNTHPKNNPKWITAGWLSARLPVLPDSASIFLTGVEIFRRRITFGHLNFFDLGKLIKIEEGNRARFNWQFTIYYSTWLWGCHTEAYWYDGDEPDLTQIKLDELGQILAP